MKEKPANSELLRISEAVARLEAGMYGSFNRPEQIVKIKTFEPRLSVGSGDRKQHAAALIDVAISTGDLPVYVLADSPGAQAAQTLLQVPLGILSQMIRIRGGLPDHAIRAERFRDKAPVSKELLGALTHSALYVPRDAFDSWYKSARSKRNWPSQRSSKKSRTGRPSKQSDGLRHSIIAFVNEGKWSAQQNSLASLMRLLERVKRRVAKPYSGCLINFIAKMVMIVTERVGVQKRITVDRLGPDQIVRTSFKSHALMIT